MPITPCRALGGTGGKMGWTMLLRQLARFLWDERGGESVEYALTSVVAVTTAAVAQRVMTDGVSEFASRALEPPSPAR